jgi:hypothetical protein
MKIKKNKYIKKREKKELNSPYIMDFLNFNNIFFLKLFYQIYDKNKNRQSHDRI